MPNILTEEEVSGFCVMVPKSHPSTPLTMPSLPAHTGTSFCNPYWRNYQMATDPELYEGIQGQGAAVKELQTLLRNKGYTNITADGIFGPKTTTAVRDFQTKNGLTVDGRVGSKTWAALRSSGGGGGTPIKLVDVCQYYDPTKYPHQTGALEWLQNSIPKATMEEFARRWRKQ